MLWSYRLIQQIPSGAAAAPASLPLRVHAARRLLAGALFRRPHFAPRYQRLVFLPSAAPVAGPVSLPLRRNPMRLHLTR